MKRPYIEFNNGDGVKYRIFFRKVTKKDLKGTRTQEANGVCFGPHTKHPKIIIDPTLKEKKMLAVLIEEYFHSWLWDQPEKLVRPFSRTLAEIITMLGWVRVKEEKKKKKDKK